MLVGNRNNRVLQKRLLHPITVSVSPYRNATGALKKRFPAVAGVGRPYRF